MEVSERNFLCKRKKGGDWLVLITRTWNLHLYSVEGCVTRGPHMMLVLAGKAVTVLSPVTKCD